jgi:hypothetical protein
MTVGFLKKLENLAAAVALYVAYFNYCWRPHKPGTTGKRGPTPAMAAGLTNRPWTLEELLIEIGLIKHEQLAKTEL